jgi:DNA-binding NtrC family response regulator
VRELRNVIRRAAILTQGRGDRPIDADALELPPSLRHAEPPPAGAPTTIEAASGFPSLAAEDTVRLDGRTFDEIEREVLFWALRRNSGSRRRAARSLAIARSTFCDKVRRYGLSG